MAMHEFQAWEQREAETTVLAASLGKEIQNQNSQRFRRTFNFEFRLLNKLARRARDRELIGLTLDHQSKAEAAKRKKRFLTTLLTPLGLIGLYGVYSSGVFSLLSPTQWVQPEWIDRGSQLVNKFSSGYDAQIVWPERVWIASGKELAWQDKYKAEVLEISRKKNYERTLFPKPGEKITENQEIILQSLGQGALFIPREMSSTGSSEAGSQKEKNPIAPDERLARQNELFERAIGRRGTKGVSNGRTSTIFLGSGQLSAEDRMLLLSSGSPLGQGAQSSTGWKNAFESLPADPGAASLASQLVKEA